MHCATIQICATNRVNMVCACVQTHSYTATTSDIITGLHAHITAIMFSHTTIIIIINFNFTDVLLL